jgi:tetratricopeptide (TPR) repeat protein
MDDWWWRRGWRGVVTTGSGLSVNGRYDGDKWKLNLHLGSSALGEKLLWGRQSPVVCRPTTRWPYFSFNDGWYDSGWAWTTYGWRWYNSSDYSIDAYPPGYVDPALTGQQTVPPAAAAAAQANQNQTQADQPAAEPEPGPLARGIVALYLEQAEEAVSAFRDYVKAEPTDHQAKRLYAMALVENKEFDDAVSMMSLAYRQDPGLAGQPIDAESLGLEDSRIRNMLTKIVAFGHRSDRASAWLTAAVLMQAEGRQKQALAMVEKARKAGLDAEVADPLSAELKRK